MHSVKPGRGPSAMGAIGGVFVALFGVLWTVGAARMGAPGFFVLFGVVFVIMAVVGVFYNAHNATARNRFSQYDITTGGEESDPMDEMLGLDRRIDGIHFKETGPEKREGNRRYQGAYCPFCGQKVEESFDYCPGCGRDI